jgi:hypothetical protein
MPDVSMSEGTLEKKGDFLKGRTARAHLTHIEYFGFAFRYSERGGT